MFELNTFRGCERTSPVYILKETSNSKSELVLLDWTPDLYLRFVLYDIRFANIFIIAKYGDMNY